MDTVVGYLVTVAGALALTDEGGYGGEDIGGLKWWGFCTDAEASDLRLCVQLQTECSHFGTCGPVGLAGKKANVFLKI